MIQQLNGNPVAAQPLTRTARMNDRLHRLAVCSWSLQPACPEDLVEKLVSTGIRQIQLALAPFREAPKIWVYAEHLFRAHDIKIISGMIDCIREDYSTLETIRQTGGIAPDALWHRNIENMHLAAMRAQTLGLQLVSFHAGFFPNDERDPAYAKMCQRLHEVASVFQKYGIVIGLETGQETAFELAQVLRQINHPNLGVNFDPANMILYDKGDPLAALHVLAPWIRQVHIKDARRTKVPGNWGEEVVVGTGDVDWRLFFEALNQENPKVNLVIEREQGTERVADIRAARFLVEKTLS